MNDIEMGFADERREYAEIILPLALPFTYTYSIPENLQNEVMVGCRVEVVFGKQKKYSGIIKRFVEKPSFPTKDILSVIDTEPIVFEQQLQLWNWMSEYYMCSEGEVMNAALPSHLKLSSESIIYFNEEYGDDFSDLNDEEYIIAEALFLKKELKLSEVKDLSNRIQVFPLVRKLSDKKVCFVFEELDSVYKEKIENFVYLNPGLDNDQSMNELMDTLSRAPKQLELLLSFLHFSKTKGEVSQNELLKKAGASVAQLKGLTDKNVLYVQKKPVDRLPALQKINHSSFVLSESQQQAHKEIELAFQQKKICLLYGVTGSGKTMLYMKQIEKIISEGKQALYLLPEISLTSQIIRKLQKDFGGYVAIYHSKFSPKERIEIWNKVKNKEVNVVVGARSALFLPFTELNLVIIDEEQDSSFKQQDPAPRYNARDTAIYYASLFKANVILGTATPSLESFYNVKKEKYTLVRLNERYGQAVLPEIKIIDLKTVMNPGKRKVMLSPALLSAMKTTLESHKQVILFQNRRGYSPFLICGTCGYIPKCTQCDVSLTLHKSSNKLHCHYCGTVYSRMVQCPACGSTNWLEKNFGTEKVEEELVEHFPTEKIARMDVDAVRGKYAHDQLIRLFEDQRIDILVGTQMVVKGLDFENVMLIGILDADGLLNFADFRVNERAFQLMEQVSGRAGRKAGDASVLIQATQTEHPVLLWVKHHNYESFFESELHYRDLFFYPPFSRLLQITLKHKKADVAAEAAESLASQLKANFKNVLGPAVPVIGRIRNQYLRDITLKLPPDRHKLQQQKAVIRNQIDLLKSIREFRNVSIVADVDPL